MKLLASLLLFLVAFLLFAVLFVPALFIQLVRSAINKSWHPIKEFARALYYGLIFLFFEMAVIIDKVGAVVFAPIFNTLLITSGASVRFGDRNEYGKYYTISEVLGFAYVEGTLTGTGRWLKEFLDLFEFDHVLKAIDHGTKSK